MGLLDLFVEKVPEENFIVDDYPIDYEDNVDASTENVTQENLIEDIYNHNGLSDLSKSIFKVEELINSLPKEMPNETKKTTVLSMLSIFGLTVDEVQCDGHERCAMIASALSNITNENNDVITSNNDLIEQKKLEIQNLEKDNAERIIIIKNAENKIEEELKRIETLIEFVGGTL